MHFINSYHRLGPAFYQRIDPEPVLAPRLFLWNQRLADELGLWPERSPAQSTAQSPHPETLAAYFSGNALLPGSEPIALAYAGHQFGHFVPQLGDGRAHLLGDLRDREGRWRDIQLKGSGRTAFSRNGDGRCALGPAVREFVMSEAMQAMGIPSCQSLAVVRSGEPVMREGPEPGAVVTRVAASHLRVGSFEFFAMRRQYAELEALADYTIQRHYPELSEAGPERFKALLERVVQRQIALVVDWMRVGFIHGVMNTDNASLSGETIDFGPCAMLGTYDPGAVFSSIDHQGRYAFGNQPSMAQWNMARLAECLMPLIDEDPDQALEQVLPVIDGMQAGFAQAYLQMLAAKLGLAQVQEGDNQLAADLLDLMQRRAMDYTLSFDRLTRSLSDPTLAAELERELPRWYPRWRQRLSEQEEPLSEAQQRMRRANPCVIPRNHHMEAVIQACVEEGDASAAEAFLEVLRSPYAETAHTARYQDAPADGDRGYQTFCGT
jgi:uncharacterized protein YdiU (UPF0061 family)